MKSTKQVRQFLNAISAERERRLNGTITEWWSVVGPDLIRRCARHMYLFSHGKIDVDGKWIEAASSAGPQRQAA